MLERPAIVTLFPAKQHTHPKIAVREFALSRDEFQSILFRFVESKPVRSNRMSCLRAAHILSKTLSGVGCVMAALLTSSSVRYLAGRGSETFISVWFSAKYCAMIPPLSVKLAAGFLIRIPVFVTKALPVNFKKRAAGFFGNQNRMISTASRAIRKIILAVKPFSRRVS